MKLLRLLLVGIVLPGCSFINEGRSFDTRKLPFLRDGVTTKAEAEEHMGRPLMRFKGEGDSETWAYHKGLETQFGVPILFMYVGARTLRSESLTLSFTGDKLTKHAYAMSLGSGQVPTYSGEPIRPAPPPPDLSVDHRHRQGR